MAFDRKKVRTSLKFIAVFPKLVKPDTKFNTDGVYETKAKFEDQADEDKFIAELKPLLDEAHAEICKEQKKKTVKKVNPWTPEVEKKKDDEGNVVEEIPTGKMLFKFKLNATMKLKDGSVIHPKPHLFDATGKGIKISDDFTISGGSVLKVAYTVRPYYTAKDNVAGISLVIKGVQIIKLVEAGGMSASACGFGQEEGGYVDEGSVSEPSMPSAGAEAPDPTDADF